MKISKGKVRERRDGRIRLPFDVAYKFFSVHDKLGFPKASQTVDWLLSQSASGIEKLSDFIVIPQTKKRATARKRLDKSTTTDADTPSKTMQANKKELRISARARARERTLEKKRLDDKNGSKISTRLEDETELYKPFNENETNETNSILLTENESFCEIIDQDILEWSDAMLMWQDGSWELDCISHVF